MQPNTQKKFEHLCTGIGKAYGVKDVSKQFAAIPTIAQTLNDKIVEKSEFLQRINVIPVTDLVGERVFGSVTGVTGKRTNTQVNERTPTSHLNLDAAGYQCAKSEYDHAIRHATIDAWAKFSNLRERYLNYMNSATALAQAGIMSTLMTWRMTFYK